MWFHQEIKRALTISPYQMCVRLSETTEESIYSNSAEKGALTGTFQLPFNVSWQEVKDHVRQVCAVDHVEIFPKSTSGWVRVKGFEHFRAAFGTVTPSLICARRHARSRDLHRV